MNINFPSVRLTKNKNILLKLSTIIRWDVSQEFVLDLSLFLICVNDLPSCFELLVNKVSDFTEKEITVSLLKFVDDYIVPTVQK